MKKLRILSLLSLSIILISSCATQNQKRQRAHLFFYQNPAELAELCARSYKDPDPIYLPGKTITKIDTVKDTVKVEITVDCPDGTEVKKEVDCPPNRTITVDNSRTDTVYRDKPETLAESLRIRNENEKLRVNLESEKRYSTEQKTRGNRWMWISIGLIGLIVGLILLRRYI